MTGKAPATDVTALNAPGDPEGSTLRSCVETALREYFKRLDGYAPGNLYEMVLQEVEQPLIRTVLDHVGGNQTRAAEILGVSRGTLRKKLGRYGLGQ